MSDSEPSPVRHRTRSAAAPQAQEQSSIPSSIEAGRHSAGNDASVINGFSSEGGDPEASFPILMTPIPGEEGNEAVRIANYLLAEIKPTAGLERLVTESIINQTREIAVLEKARVAMARHGSADQLRKLLRSARTPADEIGGTPVELLVNAWLSGSRQADEEIELLLNRSGLRLPTLGGMTDASLDRMDRISTMIGKAEHRRDRLIRTLQGNRAMIASLYLRELQGRRIEMQIAEARTSLDRDREDASGDSQ